MEKQAEAHLVSIACSSPPEGYSRWTLRLLADQMVVWGYLESVSYESVRQVLKKTRVAKLAREADSQELPSKRRDCDET